MLTLAPPIPNTSLPALMPTLELVRRHARERRQQALHGCRFYDEAMQRHYTASEASLTLLLEHVLGPLLEPRGDLVNAAEQVYLAVRALDALVHAATSPDQAVPQLCVVQTPRCLLPAREAALLVQVTLAVIQAALLDGALFLVVTMPRRVATAVLVEVESDAPGIGGDSDEARGFRRQLAACLTAAGGSLDTVLCAEGCQVTLTLAPSQE
jgi:hypothetical protein